MAIESKNLLVWVKAMSRGQALPLDASEIYSSLAEAQAYASNSAIAYAGQTIKALTKDGKYHSYMLQPSEAGYTLEEIGAVNVSDLKQYVMVVDSLPESGQVEGVLYFLKGGTENISITGGYIWDGGAHSWVQVLWPDVTSDVTDLEDRVSALETDIDTKAPIENPVFSGTVKVGADEVAVKSYVDGLFANLVSAEPGIVDSTHPIPDGYKAGQHFRVAEAGTYVGAKCEVGDLILVVKNYDADTASNDDFIVLQANIDGAVTSVAETSTVGEIVVFDAVTGKVIKGSGVQIASLNDAIAKAHEHANKNVLDSYDKSQADLLAAAKAEAEALVGTHETAVTEALAGKADKATTLAGYGIKDAYTTTEIDEKIQTLTENLNTKISASDADDKISEAKTEVLSTAAENLEARVGGIPTETTIKSYIDNAVGSGGTASAEAIANAKQEAIDASKEYTDSKLSIVEF